MRRIAVIWIATLALTVVAGFRTSANPLPVPQINSIANLVGNPKLVSAEGNGIEIYLFPARTTETYRFYIQGGLHGNELAAPRFVRWMVGRMNNGQSPLLALADKGVAFDFVPSANPDGVATVNRYNSRGVNLNRNFDVLWGKTREYPGEQAFSEPETAAIKALFAKRRYDAAIDIHGYINWVVAPSSPETIQRLETKQIADRGEAYKRWYGAIKKEINFLPNYELHTAGGLGDGGAFEDWAFWQEGVLALCLELKDEEQFTKPYRRLFENLNQTAAGRIDQFLRYEAYLYRMFEHAMDIRAPRAKEDLATLR